MCIIVYDNITYGINILLHKSIKIITFLRFIGIREVKDFYDPYDLKERMNCRA